MSKGAGIHISSFNPELKLEPTQGISGAHSIVQSINISEYHSDIRSWATKVIAQLKGSVNSHTSSGSGTLVRSLKPKYKYDQFKVIDTIGINLSRHGVFLEKGVGRGYAYRDGALVRTSVNGSINRTAKAWYNPVMQKNFSELEKVIDKHVKNAVNLNVKRMFIR